MRVASCVVALYDIHGNSTALEAVLEDAAEVRPDLVVVGGDAVSGPWPRRTIDLLRGLPGPVVYIRGNAERELLERARGPAPADTGDVWELRENSTLEQLTEDDLAFLAGFTFSETVRIEGLGETLFCHATPESDDTVITPISSEERTTRLLGSTDADVIVCGHTHMQFDVRTAGKRLVNAGSVGMPYEGRTGAFWAVIGPDVSLRHTSYDVEGAAEEIAGGDYPGAEEFAQEFVLQSYPRDETMQTFESQAIEREQQA